MNQIFRYVKIKHLVITTLALLFIIISLDRYYYSESRIFSLYNQFQHQFNKQQKFLEQHSIKLAQLLKSKEAVLLFSKEIVQRKGFYGGRNAYFFIYRNDSMLFWSNNRIAEAEFLPAIAYDNQLIQLSNGWFYVHIINSGNYKFIGLMLIKNNYSLQNQFLDNSFNPVFNLPKEVLIKPKSLKSKFNILDTNKNPVFSLDFYEKYNFNEKKGILQLCFILFWFFLMLLYIGLIYGQKSYWRKLFVILGGGGVLLLFKYLMVLYRIPQFIYKANIFQPIHFALSNILPSLGDLFLTSCIIFFIVYYAYKELQTKAPIIFKNKFAGYFISLISLFCIIIYFIFVNKLFESIIFNSNISFDMLNLSGLSYFSVFGILSIAFLFAVFLLISDFSINVLFFKDTFFKTTLFTLTTTIIIFFIYYFINTDFNLAEPVLIILSFQIIIYSRNTGNKSYNYRNIVLLIFIFSSYCIYTIYNITERKSINERKVLAVNLASEHDVIAEYLINDISRDINADTILHRLTLQKRIDYPWIYKYIRKKYFSGYWERYYMQLTICNPNDSVFIRPENINKPCLNFFNNLILHNTEKIPGTNFYFLKNPNGRISYISSIRHVDSTLNKEANLYVQLDLKPANEGLGYPELLLDERFSQTKRNFGYSYAKYYKNKLVFQSGNYPYNINPYEYTSQNKEFTFVKLNGIEHVIYRPDKDNLLLLSKPSVGIFDLLVAFSYLFIFYFIAVNILLLAFGSEWVKLTLRKDFKTRIRLTVIGVLLLSFLSVGTMSIYFIFNQYNNKNRENIEEKLRSIYMELESKLAYESYLDFTWNSYEYVNLEDLLRKLSNVFYTDINLFDNNGRMIASSRPEIFDKGLLGYYINPNAFFQLTKNNKVEYTQNERIGTLRYLSIYTPFYNNQNQLLAYLNLPYFTRQADLKQEVSSLLLTIINLYVFLILVSISFAVFISEKITQPLRFIQNKFASIKLGTRSEKIVYYNEDEIGNLVHEYNRMVDELERSVQMLTKTERELAWREMARQIAHEIKNPLTPMRLSIQQLQRAWSDKNENINEYFARVTKTLIEQIDNLSSIATEFSNFAQMPKTNNELLDLKILLTGVIDLFSESGAKFILHCDQNQKYSIIADREQISRVFINLATNAVQAIPPERQGIIEIILNRTDDKILITVHDNGLGISKEMFGKMFQPNFTTKSGGMGLGLAISKSIIENTGGQISFETSPGEGTTFFVFIPSA